MSKTPSPFELADTAPAMAAVSGDAPTPSSGRYSYVADTIPAAASRDEEALLVKLKGAKWGCPRGMKIVRRPEES